MFLSQRSRETEHFDLEDLSPAEVTAAYADLRRINRLFQLGHTFSRSLTRLLGTERCRELEILDIGAGDGSLGATLSAWAKRRGWDWRFTNLDANGQALRLSTQGRNVIGSALELPFRDNTFDAVIASQMTHHLPEDAHVVRHFQEAWRVTKDAVVIADLHRNPFLYGLVWAGTWLTGCSREVRKDGLISVRRGFRRREWRKFLEEAKVPEPEVWLYLGTRVVWQARKGRG